MDRTAQFELKTVPANQRRGGFSLTITWIAYVTVIVDLLVGGMLGSSMPLHSAIIAIFIGNIILSCIASTSSYMCYRTGRTFALLTKDTFGGYATTLLTLFVALVVLGWFTIQSSLLAHFIALQTKVGPTGESALCVLVCVGMAVPAYLGIDMLRRISGAAVPILAALCLWAWAFLPVSSKPLPSTVQLSILSAVTVVVGTWIVGSTTTIGDLFRFAKSGKAAVAGATIGLGADFLLMAAGAFAVHRYGSSDLAQVLAQSVGFVIGIAFFVVDVWPTNDNAMYSAGLDVSVATNLSHRKAVVISTLFAATAAVFRPYRFQVMTTWLGFLGRVIPPLGAVVLVTAAMAPTIPNGGQVRRMTFSLVSLGFGVLVGLTVNRGISPLNGLFVSAILQAFFLYWYELRTKNLSKAAVSAST